MSESAAVERLPGGEVIIHYHCITDDGLNMGGDFVFSEPALDWLVDKVALEAEDDLPDTTFHLAPDRFSVYCRGAMRYDDPNVNLINVRDGDRTYTISGMSCLVARTLVAQLRGLRGS